MNLSTDQTRRDWRCYLIAAAVVVAAAAVRLALAEVLGEIAPFLPFVVAVLVAAWYGGLRPGLLATALGAVNGVYFFTPPQLSWRVAGPGELVSTLMFVTIGVTVSWLVEGLHAAQERVEEQKRRLEQEVRDRARAEATERNEKERFRVTLSSIGDAVIATDAAGLVTYMNAVAETLTGWTGDEAAGIPLDRVFRIVNESTRDVVENPVDRVLRLGQVVGLANHTVLLGRDGTERAIDDSAAPIRDARGVLIGVVLVFHDVTEKRRAERDSEEAAERFRALVLATAQVVWITEPNGEIVEDSPSWREYTGQSYDEWKGWGWLDSIHPDDRQRAADTWAGALASGSIYVSEYRVRTDQGGYRWTAARGVPLLDGRGRIRQWVGMNADIHDRKCAEAALLESRERLDFALSAADLGQWDLSLTDHTAHRTALHDEIFGYDTPLPEWTYEMFLAHVVPEDRPAVDARFQAGVASGGAWDFECRIVRADGAERWIWSKARVYHDEEGRPARMLGIVGDLTDRRRTEKALEDVRNRLNLALDGGRISTWVWEPETGRIESDRNITAFFNLPDPGGPGLTLDDLLSTLHPDDRRRVATEMEEAVRAGGDLVTEYRVVSFDPPRWNYARAKVEDGRDRPARLAGVVMDVTDRKRAEAERQKLVSLVENSTDFIAMFDTGGVPLYVNRAGLAAVGLDAVGGDGGPTLPDFFFPVDRPTIVDEFLPGVLETGEGEIEVRFRNFRTGGPIWMLCRLFSLTDPDGRRIGLATVSRDITARRAMEDDLRNLAADLSDADHRKDEFLATLAHELRNPLAPLKNGLEVMRMAREGGGDVDETRAMMERQLGQLVRLVDDLMDISRISRGNLELRKERVDLAAVIGSAVETSRPLLELLGHELTVNLPGRPVPVDADLTRLAQVFLNLLNNAARYTDPGGRVDLTVTPQGAEALVSVKDTGIGIAADQMNKIFEMFSQVDSSLEKSRGGLGIGLTLVRRLVEMHGGAIEARSGGPGAGSEFIVRLPIAQGGTPAGAEAPEAALPRTNRLRILIVDDNRDGADSLAMMLSLMGNEARTAYDGEEAVAAAAESLPDVALLDIGLPKLNGHEVCRRIRRLPGGDRVLIIAQTGWGQEADRDRTAAAGFDHHLVKPVDPGNLLKLLEELSGKKTATGNPTAG